MYGIYGEIILVLGRSVRMSVIAQTVCSVTFSFKIAMQHVVTITTNHNSSGLNRFLPKTCWRCHSYLQLNLIHGSLQPGMTSKAYGAFERADNKE